VRADCGRDIGAQAADRSAAQPGGPSSAGLGQPAGGRRAGWLRLQLSLRPLLNIFALTVLHLRGDVRRRMIWKRQSLTKQRQQ